MRAHYRKRGKTWTVVIDAGKDPNGKRVQKWLSKDQHGDPFLRRKDAEDEFDRIKQKAKTGGDPFPEDQTFSEYAERWMEHQATRIRPRTLERYRLALRDYILPVLGGLKLDRIKPGHVQGVLDGISERGLSPRTAIHARAVLGSALRQAVAWGLIPTNPVAAVRPPKPERPRLEVPVADQLVGLMQEAVGTPWEVPILLAATTGARRSEVLAVRWRDVDLDTARLRITRSLQRVPGDRRLAFLDPKTDRARREIGLPGFVVERLRRHRAEQAARRLARGSEWEDLDLVCDRGDGGPLHPDAFTKAFKRLAAKAGIPAGARLHDVRHGVMTTMLAQGVHPAIASAVAGHASPAFTMNVYQHVLDGMTAQAAKALEAAYGRA